jgi:hypothetical protein
MTAISWLTLERYALGELPADEAAQVAAAVAESDDLRARLEAIQADARDLPPLDLTRPDSGLPLPPPVTSVEEAEVVPLVPRRRWGVWGAGLMAAAAALAVVFLPPQPESALPPATTTWKGGELSLVVDRSRDGSVEEDVDTFRDGDTLQLRLTCPPGERAWSAVVFQGEETARPLPDDTSLQCGNAVRLPGAFTVTGAETVEVCVAVDSTVDERPNADTEGVVCRTVSAR